jgi:hypothetical protein
MGEIQKRPFQLSFNASLRVDFQGCGTERKGCELTRPFHS